MAYELSDIPEGHFDGGANLTPGGGSGPSLAQAIRDILERMEMKAEATVAAQSQTVTVSGAETSDMVVACLKSDDTGGTLGAITACEVTAANTVTVVFANAPTNNDGVVTVFVRK